MFRVAALVLLTFITNVYSTEYNFDRYEFEWKVMSVNKINFSVVKTEDSSFVRLRKEYSGLRLTAQEAVEISKVLSKTTDYFNKQINSKNDVTDIVEVGQYTVIFYTYLKYGFHVSAYFGESDQRFRSYPITC